MNPQASCPMPSRDPLLREIVAVEVERAEDRLSRRHGIFMTAERRRLWERKILQRVSHDLCKAIRAHALPGSVIQKSIDRQVLAMEYSEVRLHTKDPLSVRIWYACCAFLDILRAT